MQSAIILFGIFRMFNFREIFANIFIFFRRFLVRYSYEWIMKYQNSSMSRIPKNFVCKKTITPHPQPPIYGTLHQDMFSGFEFGKQIEHFIKSLNWIGFYKMFDLLKLKID